METGSGAHEDICEAISLSLAKAAAIPSGKPLSSAEMNALIASLFSSPSPSYTPDGKLILYILTDDDLEKRFK
jgi:DNA mismatch repair protein MutL